MRSALLFILLCPIGSVTFAQTIRYVSATGTSTNAASATSWASSTTDLQGAINASAPGDQVWVAAGSYKPTNITGPDSRTISFSLKEGVAVYGGFTGAEVTLSQRFAVNPNTGQPSSTTLSGDIGAVGDVSDNSYHVVSNPVSLRSSGTLDGFVITGGNANGPGRYSYGGGMDLPTVISQAETFTATIRNCLFSRNKAVQGGAVFLSSGFRNGIGTPAILNCKFSENTAETGGAIYNDSVDSYRLTDCTFEKNTAPSGGVVTCVSSGSFSSGLTFANTIFRQNSATNGGVLYGTTSRGSIFFRCYNTVFDSNSATNGGVAYEAGSFGTVLSYLANCTFWNNTASERGSVVYASSQYTQNTLINCVIWNNGGSNTFANQPYVQLLNTLLEPSVIGYESSTGTLTATISPFVSATSLQLSPCSPAINAGSNTAIASLSLTTDLAGNPRFYKNSQVDMGAYEYQGDVPTPVGLAAQPAPSLTVCQNSAATASVSTSGTVSSYQWYKDGVALTGQTSATLSLPSTTTAQTGSYSVAVTGQCNSLTSTGFGLLVNPAPDAPQLTSASRIVYTSSVPLPLDTFVVPAATGTLVFSGANGLLPTPVVSVSAATEQVYTVRQQGTNGCLSAPTAFTLSVVPLLAVEPTGVPFAISLAPNPIAHRRLRASVQGAEGRALSVQLLSLTGAVLHDQQWSIADAIQRVEWAVSHCPAGVYLLRAQAGAKAQTVNVLIE